MGKGVSYSVPVEQARRLGRVTINQYDQHPKAIAFRKAVYRAVKRGLLQRIKSPPSRATYTLNEGNNV